MHLLSLIGEQPIPNLLVSRALQPERQTLCSTERTQKLARNLQAMLPGSQDAEAPPYDLAEATRRIAALCGPDTWINLTGGTKPMAFAAYEVARQRSLPFVYLQSEGAASVLYSYTWQDGLPRLVERRVLGSLICIDDYLQAHGLQPVHNGAPVNSQETGLRRWFEAHVDECQANQAFEGFEIDFILRRGNQAAIVEAKMVAKNTRHGIDQLNTIGGKTYLGTYTGKILVVSKPLGPQLSRLAEARQVLVVLVQGRTDQRTGRLLPDAPSQARLFEALRKTLGDPSTQGPTS
jgi:hypothetical protein